MERRAVMSKGAPAALGPYSHAVAAGGFLFCSGQTGLDPATGVLAQGIEAQTRRVLDNLKAVLESAGLSMAHIVKTTIFLTDMGDFQTVNGIYASYFSSEPPARSTVQVAALPKAGIVEIEAIAAFPQA